MTFDIETLAWQKVNGLMPAIVQDIISKQVLMLGYMDKMALQKTLSTKLVTFYSRTRAALWVKGETSGNYLQLCEITADCDKDTLLITARAKGPTCHQGSTSCFPLSEDLSKDVLLGLEQTIKERQNLMPKESYVASLFAAGTARIAQKVGEEGVEVALAALTDPQNLCEEVADLLFHILVLLREKDLAFADVLSVLAVRSKKS
ncbi:MAG: bifunctional phosphoribosyl-AMP cyclohydrolase/phosphoribosyl-ATP diphosphatase HisIE [Proteobacteria bacterium]|nr:bifunctional phosphoribosyl-AMP cyclohydrolase/phosphoribosyl-ATP diphosphatase HisIE [Pseudomonadota bacterium]